MWGPAGITHNDEALPRTFTVGNGLEDLYIRRNCEAVVHNLCRTFNVVAGMQHKAPPPLYRATVMENNLPLSTLALDSRG